MRSQDTPRPAARLRARPLAVRPVGSWRWLPTRFRTKAHLRCFLFRSDFCFLDFGRSAWVITPDGLPLKIRTARPVATGLVA